MNKKLKRVLEEIQKTENKIAMWQEHLKELNVYKEQIEDREIIKSVRSLKLDSWSLMDVLDKMNAGDVSFLCDCREEREEESVEADMQDHDLNSQEKMEESSGLSEESKESGEEDACRFQEKKEENG